MTISISTFLTLFWALSVHVINRIQVILHLLPSALVHLVSPCDVVCSNLTVDSTRLYLVLCVTINASAESVWW